MRGLETRLSKYLTVKYIITRPFPQGELVPKGLLLLC